MRPHYQRGNVRLYCGDCRKILPEILAGDPIDVVITDPVWPDTPPGLLVGAEDPAGLLRDTLALIDARRVVLTLGFASDPRFLRVVPERWPFIRSQQMPYAVPGYRGRLLCGDEVAYIFGDIPRGRGVIPGRATVETVWKSKRANGHPCPRSETHFSDLVKWWTLQKETILDPFMGSGTTIVAAVKFGRAAVGIECEPRYFEIACKRVDQAFEKVSLFDLKPAAGRQPVLFNAKGEPAL